MGHEIWQAHRYREHVNLQSVRANKKACHECDRLIYWMLRLNITPELSSCKYNRGGIQLAILSPVYEQ